jgi:hypothetical protein
VISPNDKVVMHQVRSPKTQRLHHCIELFLSHWRVQLGTVESIAEVGNNTQQLPIRGVFFQNATQTFSTSISSDNQLVPRIGVLGKPQNWRCAQSLLQLFECFNLQWSPIDFARHVSVQRSCYPCKVFHKASIIAC